MELENEKEADLFLLWDFSQTNFFIVGPSMRTETLRCLNKWFFFNESSVAELKMLVCDQPLLDEEFIGAT